MATIVEIAKHIGVTPKYVQDLINEGVIERKDRGSYDINECRNAYIKKLRESAAGRANSGDLNLTDERARLAKEQADAKEMENAINRGELVYIEDVAKRVEVALSKVKIKILAIPTKVAPEAAAADNAKDVQALIERHIIEALNELSGINETSADQET